LYNLTSAVVSDRFFDLRKSLRKLFSMQIPNNKTRAQAVDLQEKLKFAKENLKNQRKIKLPLLSICVNID